MGRVWKVFANVKGYFFSHAEKRNAASFRPIARLTLQYMQVRSAKAGRLFISY